MAKYSINDDRFSVVNLNLFSSHSYLLTWYEDWRASGRIVIQSRFEWRSFRPQVVSPPNQSRFAPDQSRFASKLILNQKVDSPRQKKTRFGANASDDLECCWNEQTLRPIISYVERANDMKCWNEQTLRWLGERANASDYDLECCWNEWFSDIWYIVSLPVQSTKP